MADTVGAVAAFVPVAFFPVVERQDLAAALVEAGSVAVDVDLVEALEQGEGSGCVPRDAFEDFVVAEPAAGVGGAVVVIGGEDGGEGEGEEYSASAHGDEVAVEDDGPPLFGESAEVPLFAGIVVVECGRQG